MAHQDEPARIAQALQELDLLSYGDVLQCMRCGLCLPTCPTYRTDGLETQSPRGRVAMIKGVIDGILPADQDFIDHMYHCLDCRNCQTVCPAGVKAAELILDARHRIEENRPQPRLKRFMLEDGIRDQKRLSRFMTPFRLYQATGLQALVRKYDILKYVSEDLRIMEALLPRLPACPLMETIPQELPAHGPERARVGFFLGCAMNLMFADVSRATIEVLRRGGFTVLTPKGQQCCGAPNIAQGERKVYRDMAVHNMDLFLNRDLSAIVTDCAACGAELKVYHEIMAHGGKQATQAETFSAMVRDVNEFLAQELPADMRFGPIPEVACFHDPCHLRHAQGVVAPPRRLLRRIPELTLVDIPDNGQCCGSAGIYNVTHRERSMKILHAKVEAIRRTGASRVITSNPGCLMQLEVGDRLWNQPWHVSHIAEVLLRSLQIGENTNELGTPAVTAG
jgi:glycolate oxidase iron-sulfur subunit